MRVSIFQIVTLFLHGPGRTGMQVAEGEHPNAVYPQVAFGSGLMPLSLEAYTSHLKGRKFMPAPHWSMPKSRFGAFSEAGSESKICCGSSQVLHENEELEEELARVRAGNLRAAEILAGPLPPPLPQPQPDRPAGGDPPQAVATASGERPPGPQQPPPPQPEAPKRPRLDDE